MSITTIEHRILLVCLGTACARPPAVNSEAAALPLEAPRGVQVATEVVPYAVHGGTRPEVAREMWQTGPTVNGQHYAGATQWDVTWTFQFGGRTSPCTIRDVTARVGARIRLPRWEPTGPPTAGGTNAPLWWEDYRARLVEHERGHVRIATEAAANVVRRLGPLTDTSCNVLTTTANRLGGEIVSDARAQEIRYDAETHHGALTVPAAP